MFDDTATAMIPAILWDLRAQLEAQLRRVEAAQSLWTASKNGANLKALAGMTTATDEMVSANDALRDATNLLSDQLTNQPPAP